MFYLSSPSIFLLHIMQYRSEKVKRHAEGSICRCLIKSVPTAEIITMYLG